jgi:hypothetical protein
MGERVPRHVLDEVVAGSERELGDDLAKLLCPLLVAYPEGYTGVRDAHLIARFRSARPDVEVVAVRDAPHDIFRPDRLLYPRPVADFLSRRYPGL